MPIDLKAQRATTLETTTDIVDRAERENRDLTEAENDSFNATMVEIEKIDRQIKGRALVHSVTSLGSSNDDGEPGQVRYLSLRRDGTKSRVAARASTTSTGRRR